MYVCYIILLFVSLLSDTGLIELNTNLQNNLDQINLIKDSIDSGMTNNSYSVHGLLSDFFTKIELNKICILPSELLNSFYIQKQEYTVLDESKLDYFNMCRNISRQWANEYALNDLIKLVSEYQGTKNEIYEQLLINSFK
jgi:hypothetical protein